MADNILKKQLDCISEDFLKGIFTGLAKPAWGALTHIFGRVTTGKGTLVADIARPLRADSSRAGAKRAEEKVSGWLGRWDFSAPVNPWLLGFAAASDDATYAVDFSDVSKEFGGGGMEGMAMGWDGSRSIKSKGRKGVVRVNDMKRDVFGDGLGIEASLAPVPFRTAHLRTHRGDRRVEMRWRRGFVQCCEKPGKKDAPVENVGVLVVESRFDGKSVWLYAVCPDVMYADGEGAFRVAARAAQAYCDRRQIETSFQAVKQEFALEKARVRTFRRLENVFSPCILAYVFATDFLRRAKGFRKVLKFLSDNLEAVSLRTHALLAGIRALVDEPRLRFISGRPPKVRPKDARQMEFAL